MRKSFTKRIKITSTGKYLRRKMSQDHFRAKKTGGQIRNKRKGLTLAPSDAKVFKRQMRLN